MREAPAGPIDISVATKHLTSSYEEGSETVAGYTDILQLGRSKPRLDYSKKLSCIAVPQLPRKV
jgi:hypothetical protein